MALDCIVTGREAARGPLLAKGAVLYSNKRDPNAVLPHAWLYCSTETPGSFRGWTEDLAYLHLWGRSQAEIQELENSVEFLDDYSAASSGNALVPHWTLQSKTRFIEDDGETWHTAAIYVVRWGDKRKLLAR